MAQRRIPDQEVREVLRYGSTIVDYPDDQPYPSRLIFATVGSRHLHVLVAENRDAKEVIVITVYEPDPRIWDDTLRKRR